MHRVPELPAELRRGSSTLVEPSAGSGGVDLAALIPDAENALFDIKGVINGLIDEGSFFEIKQRFAKEIVTGFARLDGAAIGIIANNSKYLGGVFSKTAPTRRRSSSRSAMPSATAVVLADVPGFMIGSKVEREGIIRHGAKMLHAMASASVPKISVVVRKAYGAGLYAMCGKGFAPDTALALRMRASP